MIKTIPYSKLDNDFAHRASSILAGAIDGFAFSISILELFKPNSYNPNVLFWAYIYGIIATGIWWAIMWNDVDR